MKMAKLTRSVGTILEELITELQDVYDCLEDFTFRNKVRENVKRPNFETYRANYDNLKEQIVTMCEKANVATKK